MPRQKTEVPPGAIGDVCQRYGHLEISSHRDSVEAVQLHSELCAHVVVHPAGCEGGVREFLEIPGGAAFPESGKVEAVQVKKRDFLVNFWEHGECVRHPPQRGFAAGATEA